GSVVPHPSRYQMNPVRNWRSFSTPFTSSSSSVHLYLHSFPTRRSSDLQQQVSEIMRQMLTQAQTAGQYFTNDQIKEMTRKVSAEVDLVHQQTQNQRYGSSHIGATAKDISNVVTDAASGVV